MKLVKYISHALLCGALLFTCGQSPTAGGSADSGGVKLAGVIFTDSGTPAIGATVTICPENYTASIASDSADEERSFSKKTLTDQNGHFQFDSMEEGNYYLEGNDGVSSAALLRVTIPDSSGTPLYYENTLRPYAAVEGNIGRSLDTSSKRFVLIYGTDRIVPVATDGNFAINDLPFGTFHFRIVVWDSSDDPIDVDSVTLVAGATLSLPFMGWRHHARISLNTTSSGAAISGTVAGFPVLIRLTKDNFIFSEAAGGGVDIGFAEPDGSLMGFEIERWDSQQQVAEIWVKTDTISGNDDSRYFSMFWGNPAMTQPKTIETAVFDTSDGFQLVWHLSDSRFDSAVDATGNNFDGVVSGMTPASIVNGKIGNARLFDGSTSCISVENSSNGKLNFPEDGMYSLSAWVYAEALDQSSQAVISKGDEQYFLYGGPGSSNGAIWSFTEFKDETGWTSTTSPAEEGQWVLLTGVKNGASQYLFVNGESADSSISSIPSTKSRITSFDVAIGKFMENGLDAGDGFFDGIIDEIRISSTPLTADWIKLCFMNQRADDRLVIFQRVE